MGTIKIHFEPIIPAAINGYLVKYRRVGDPFYTTLVPNQTNSPVSITGVNNTYSYEGTIQADCGSKILSSAVPFTVEPCIGDNKKYINNICETGTRMNVSSTPTANPGEYACQYHYLFSDATTSATFIEITNVNCMEGGI